MDELDNEDNEGFDDETALLVDACALTAPKVEAEAANKVQY